MRRSLLLLFVLGATALGCGTQQAGHSQFDAGRQALMRGQYETAIEKLQSYLRGKPRGGLASRASFLIAKAYLGLGQYQQSRQNFEQTIRKYPLSEEAHKSRYKLAILSLLEGNHADARRRFGALIEKPSGTLVPEAAAMLRHLNQGAADEPSGEA